MTNIIKDMVDRLQPQTKAGRPPKVRHCPHCHAALNVTQMKRHRPQCKRDHRNAPPQPPQGPTPDDLENQVFSNDPLQRQRQLDQREQDRIRRS